MIHQTIIYSTKKEKKNQFKRHPCTTVSALVHSANLKDNSGLLQEVLGQRSPHNHSAVEWNNRHNHTQKPVKLREPDQDMSKIISLA